MVRSLEILWGCLTGIDRGILCNLGDSGPYQVLTTFTGGPREWRGKTGTPRGPPPLTTGGGLGSRVPHLAKARNSEASHSPNGVAATKGLPR